MQPAMFWTPKENQRVLCQLCPKYCTIAPNKTGFCKVRKNVAGELYTLNFAHLAAHAMDPIEKKPLYHYYPGKYILSLGTTGCNFRCGYCQNWNIAQQRPQTIKITAEHVAKVAAHQQPYPNLGVAYTYSEPLMWYEFVYQTAPLIHQQGMKNILVTNGYINEEPLRALLPYIDAMNIDLKAFSEEYYQKNCVGQLAPVLRTVELAHQHCHIELTTLLIPGLNDSAKEIAALVDWVADLDPNIPLHFSRYFPSHQFEIESTPPATLKKARQIALKKLKYVYLGNLSDAEGLNTYCSQCQRVVVNRTWYNGKVVGVDEKNRCKKCGEKIPLHR